jgi:hypothetical protein
MIDHFKNANLVPRYHGNGFAQLYLNDQHRLHVWHPLLPMPPENNAQIHDHIWDLASQVLVGQLGHITYDLNPEESSHDMYEINQPAVRENENDVFKFLNTAAPQATGNYMMNTGSIYHFRHGLFHQTTVADGILTASLIRKGPDILDSPRLLVPSGETPFQAFGEGVSPPEADLWEAIKEALEQMPEMVRNHLVNLSPVIANDNESEV